MATNTLSNGFSYAPDHEAPLNIIIVGGGISGLASAVALRQAGHEVTIYEESDFTNEGGLVIRLGPNTSGLLKRWGFTSKTASSVQITHVAEFNVKGELNHEKDPSNLKNIYQHPWEYYDRAILHSALLDTATSATRPGPAVKIKLKSPVAHVEVENVNVVLKNGERVKSDVILAADGAYSPIREALFDIKASPIEPGKVATNFALATNGLSENSIVSRFETRSGRFESWIYEGRQMDIYLVKSGFLIFNCAYVTPTGSQSRTNATGASLKAETLEVFKKFAPELLQVLEKIDPAEIRSWPQNDIPSVQTWSIGNVAFVGDAAHPFLPTEAQGSAQALEDAAALGAVLPFGTTPAEVEGRLKVYQESRQERVNTILNFTRENNKDGTGSKIKKFEKSGPYTYGHDAHDWATGNLRQYLATQAPISSRMPSAFGIFPSPRQSLTGKPHRLTESSFRTATITFETSRTYLQNLLPTADFSIVSPGNIALASFSVSTLGNLEWLGGRGYNSFSFSIYNVQAEKVGGESTAAPVTGRYLAVAFENMADPILSGREELGIAKLFATIDIESTDSDFKMVAGWEGTPFAEVRLGGLQIDDSTVATSPREPIRKSLSSVPDQGLLHYKSIPGTGKSVEADAAYVTITPSESTSGRVVHRKYVTSAEKASVKFLEQKKKNLPTLWNIVEGLKGVEIFKVVGAEIVEGHGIRDLSGQTRI